MKIIIVDFLFRDVTYGQEKTIEPSKRRMEIFNSAHGFYQYTVNGIISDTEEYLWKATFWLRNRVRYFGFSEITKMHNGLRV